ncbi:MAG: hypothetical protein EWM72_02907 [Nitrospira sp.]|nr:MAG: hypothetical protein EWM72_02907 [Nitrospira sp.]
MNCSRCRGLMVEDHFLDFDGTIGHMWTTGYRCMNCGHVHYPVIVQHCLARQEQVSVLPSGEPDYQDDEVHLGAESYIARAA